jgi:hypothetical protein
MRTAPLRVALLATLLVACHDSTGPKNAAGVTKEGIVVAARISRPTFGPSDTVWATGVLTNPTGAAVTLHLTQVSEGGALVAGVWALPGQTPQVSQNTTFGGGYISGISTLQPTGDLVVPAHDSLTYRFPMYSYVGAPTGTYSFRAAIHPVDPNVVGVSTVASNTVTATLHD